MKFLDELKRRNVLRVAAAYVVSAWLVIQVVETILPQYGLEHHVRTVITVLAIGFLPALILAWALEWTPAGIKRDDGIEAVSDRAATTRASRRFDRIVIVILTIALAWFAYDKLVPAAPDVQYSVAVLPFINESPNEIPDYLADGIATEVRDLLAKLPQLLVIERSSAYSFRGQDVGFPEIGNRLGVTHLLTGAVANLGDNIRVRAQLVDAAGGDSLWSRVYTGTLGDIFSIQDEIASEVTSRLDVQTAASLPKSRRTTPEALALTLQAEQLWNDKIAEADVDTITTLLDEALDLDPDYTRAMLGKVAANWSARLQGRITAQEENERWLKLASRILAIEPENAVVHVWFAWEAMYKDRDLQAAAYSYARALRSAPNDAEVLRQASRFAVLIGRKEDGIAMIERSMAVDPLCTLCLYGASRMHMYVGNLDRAIALRERFLRINDSGGEFHYGIMKLLQGNLDEALAIFEDIYARYPSDANARSMAHAGLAMAFHDLGRQAESDEQLAIYVENYGDEDPRTVAMIHAWRNEKDEAFEWFHRADDMGQDREGMLIANPLFKNLHGDPRWEEILEVRGFSDNKLATLDFPVELLTLYGD